VIISEFEIKYDKTMITIFDSMRIDLNPALPIEIRIQKYCIEVSKLFTVSTILIQDVKKTRKAAEIDELVVFRCVYDL
jgi:hypothetical protein